MAMTKKVIIEMIYDKMALSRTEGSKILERFLEIISDELTRGADVMISGFGRWSIKKKSARKGRNPQTGEKATISARKIVTFKCSGQLRNKINGRY